MTGTHKENLTISMAEQRQQQKKQRQNDMQFAAQIVAKELDRKLEAMKSMPQGPEMRRSICRIQDTIFRLVMVAVLGVPLDFLTKEEGF